MTDWAAKLLADVPRYTFLSDYGHLEQFIEEADALAAIDRMGREMALDVLASSGQAQEAYAAQIAAEAERDYTHGTNEVLRAENQRIEAERDALMAQVTRLEAALSYYADQYCEGFCQDLPPGYTDENCERDCGGCKARAALTDGGKDG